MSNGSDIMREIRIGDRLVGDDHPPFIVAEVGLNHNGSIDRAIEMIHAAVAAGVDAVKFQTFRAAELVGGREQLFTYRSQGREVTEPMLDMFARHELPDDAWPRLRAECDGAGIRFLSTPQNVSDLEILLRVGVNAVKVGSDDFTNLPLLRRYAKTGLPLILSCGMSTLAEVYAALEAVGTFEGYPTVLLLCTSQYPTPPLDVNVRKLNTLRGAFPNLVVGFSDHTQGSLAATMALALGARVFEKHFTLDHNLPGPDHWFSETPETLRAWCAAIRTGYEMLGDAIVRPTAVERNQKRDFRRFLVAARAIVEGEPYREDNVLMRRHPDGRVPATQFDEILGRPAPRAYAPGEPIDG
jgi:sialic acid synthase SpsE